MTGTVKYANNFVLSAKEETVSATGYARLTVGKPMEWKSDSQGTHPPLQITIDQKQLKNVEYFNYTHNNK